MPGLNGGNKYIVLSEKLGYHLFVHRRILDVSAEHSDMIEVVETGSVGSHAVTVASVLACKGSEVATLLLDYLLLFVSATDRRNF
jgi:hypothetical protein